jgi:hypothetical protein
MRSMIRAAWIVASCLLATVSAQAAVIKGRVVDSAGQPVAGAEIRVWRRGRAVGGVPAHQPVSFDGSEVLHADDAGRFATPDVFDASMPVRIVAQAAGMLAGRSGWIRPEQEVVEVEDIVLPRLLSVVGQVVDTQGAAVAGAIVFNGDGHQRVETKSGSTGKFFLDNVPDGALFLFAEKPGFLLTGIMLGGEKSVELRLARTDEPTEPLRSHKAVLTPAERAALVHRVLDPYLDAVTRNGSDPDKQRTLEELARSDPMAALAAMETVGFSRPGDKENTRYNVIVNWMRCKHTEDWDQIFALAKSWASDDWALTWPVDGARANRDGIDPLWPRDWAASWLAYGATSFMPMTDERRARQWLDEAIVLARDGVRPMTRVAYLATAAEGFSRLGDRERAATVAREAEVAANELPPDQRRSDYILYHLAKAFAPFDLAGALARLDQVKDDYQFASNGASIALRLVRTEPAQAEEVWNHLGLRQPKQRSFIGLRDESAPDVCFRLAKIDPEAAHRVADTVRDALQRARARAAIALALGGETAKELLRKTIADPEIRQIPPELYPRQNTATVLAWFLPVMEEIDATIARELFWKALSLRAL